MRCFKPLFLSIFLLLGVDSFCCLAQEAPTVAARLQFGKNGKFKIVQLADTHVIAGDPRSDRALSNIAAILDSEKPDFVIHTGDILYGEPAEESVRAALQPLVERGIPFAVALGNHDSDFSLSRQQMYELVRSIPGNVNTPANEKLDGYSNDILVLQGKNGGTCRVFYLFDSGNRDYPAGEKSWGYIHESQILWYRAASQWFTAQNGGAPVPSLAFFHIPFPEFNEALHYNGKKAHSIQGNIGEEPASPKVNSGLYLAMREQGDVQGVVCGHDHNNDFAMLWKGFFFLYGRYSGCDTVYNDLKPNGARVFEFTEADDGFRTWIRLCDGRIQQELYLFPGMKNLTSPR